MTRPAHHTALRTHAQGISSLEAATDLIIRHAVWLRRSDFTAAFIDAGPGAHTATSLSWIDWQAATTALNGGDLPCAGSEAGILRLAASIAAGVPVDLRDALTGLDAHNAHLVCAAVQHATGHR